MKWGLIASVENIEGRVEDSRSIQVLPEILSRQEVEQLVFLPCAADIAAKEFARVGVVLTTRHGSSAGCFISKISKQLAVKIVSTRLGDHVDRARGSQSGRWRQQRLLHSDLLDGTHRNIHGGCAHGLVSDVESIHLHAGGAAIATDDRGRGESNLGRGQYRAVEQLHSRF